MFKKSRSVEQLEQELEAVNREIAAHPFEDASFKTAQELVEREKAAGTTSDDIDALLAEQGLPSLQELGKLTVTAGYDWWNLHRRRNKLIKKLDAKK